MEVDISLHSERIICELKQIIAWRGEPQVIRCNNGTQYISGAIQNWAAEWGIRLEHIQPNNPQQKAYVERFNRTVRYKWLCSTTDKTCQRFKTSSPNGCSLTT
jgi:putative transposase